MSIGLSSVFLMRSERRLLVNTSIDLEIESQKGYLWDSEEGFPDGRDFQRSNMRLHLRGDTHSVSCSSRVCRTLFWSDRFIFPIQEIGQASTGKMKKIHSQKIDRTPVPSRLTVQSLLGPLPESEESFSRPSIRF